MMVDIGMKRMVISQYREKSYRFHLVKVGTGEHEKITQHTVAVPVGCKIGQAVKKIIPALAVRSNYIVYLTYECLKTLFRVEMVNFGAACGIDKRQDVWQNENRPAGYCFLLRNYSKAAQTAGNRLWNPPARRYYPLR